MTTAANERTAAVTTDDLIRRAQDMIPTLRARGARCEELRRIPAETIEDFKAADLHRIAQPPAFGGLGHDIDTVTKVAIQIGRGCASTAWMAGQWPGHNFMVGYFQEQAQQEYWADSDDVLSSTASATVRLQTDEVAGGTQASGQMRFSSGCDAAEWILLFTPAAMCLVPRSDFRVEDDWHTMGLRGTGSKSVVFDDIFIPDHRTVPIPMVAAGRSYGYHLYPENPYYGAPMMIVLNTMLLAPLIGMARGLIDRFSERATARIDLHTFQPAANRPGTQLRFAEACAEVDAAELLLERILSDIREAGAAGTEMPRPAVARVRRDVAYATKLCVAAADRLATAGDASGMYDKSDVQRWYRDIHMGALQYMLTWDEPAMAFSQLRWGLDPECFTS